MTKYYKKKRVTLDIIEEEGKWLKCITYFRYNFRTKKISVTNTFYYNRTYVRTGLPSYNRSELCHLSISKEGLRPISDKEIKEKVRELIIKKPSLSINELAKETGYSQYKLNRVYMPVKRGLC